MHRVAVVVVAVVASAPMGSTYLACSLASAVPSKVYSNGSDLPLTKEFPMRIPSVFHCSCTYFKSCCTELRGASKRATPVDSDKLMPRKMNYVGGWVGGVCTLACVTVHARAWLHAYARARYVQNTWFVFT